jgi:hypothetical protein
MGEERILGESDACSKREAFYRRSAAAALAKKQDKLSNY